MAMEEEMLKDYIPQQPTGDPKEGFIEASFTPAKMSSWDLSGLKRDYQELMRFPHYYDNRYRRRVIDSANLVFSEAAQTGFDALECQEIEGTLAAMERLDEQCSNVLAGFQSTNIDARSKSVLDDTYISPFQDKARQFLLKINVALQRHGQLFKTRSRMGELEKLEKVFIVKNKNRFMNSFGIPISLEIDVMANIMAMRVRNKLDNFFPTQGATGFGKTSFAWALGSTVAEKLGQTSFSPVENFIFNESTTYVEERLRTAIPGSIIVLDEFGNQANKRRFYEDGQINFMDRLKLLRFHGLTLLPCWPAVDELDGQLQTKIHGIFTIAKERETAQLSTFNLNKFAKKKEFIPNAAKNMIAFTTDESNKIIEDYDEFNLLTLPFYEIPVDKWNAQYEPFKESANQVGRAAKGSITTRKQADMLYYEFISKLPANCVRITWQQLQEFSHEKNFYLEFGALVRKIAEGIGRKRGDIYKMDMDAKRQWDGSVDVDEYVDKYIKKIKAQYVGAKATDKFEAKQNDS